MFSTKNPNLITQEEKKEITVLDISNQRLQGSLKLQGFVNLKILICSHNELVDISIDEKSLTNLTRFDCSYNQIKKVKF